MKNPYNFAKSHPSDLMEPAGANGLAAGGCTGANQGRRSLDMVDVTGSQHGWEICVVDYPGP